MGAFSYCAHQSNHANISINLKRKDGRQTDGSNNCCILKIHWKLKLKPSFVFICLFLSSVAFSSKRSLFSNGSIFLRTRAKHGENALMIGQNYSNFFSFMVTFSPVTWPTNNSLWLVRIISNLCPYMARLTPYVFNGRPPTLENHNERCINWHFSSFITKSSSTTKLRLPSSSQILAKISICSDYNPFQALFLFNSRDISQVYTMRDSANWSSLACGVSLYTIPWRHVVT